MKRISGVLIVAASALLSSETALACSCVPPEPGLPEARLVARARDTSTAVFSAKVVTLEPSGGSIAVHLLPERVWKGLLSGELVVRTGRGGGDCGFRFQLGEEYLVYAFGASEASLGTNRCTRTRPLAQAGSDLRALGAGRRLKR